MPTLNAFDMGDSRATVIIFEATRVDDVRIYDKYCPTVATYWGTGGARVPYVFELENEDQVEENNLIAFDTQFGSNANTFENLSPTLKALQQPPSFSVKNNLLAVAYDEYNDSIADTHHVLRAGTKQSTGVIQSSVVRRLTPVECERLQGFPDAWTADQADSHRYKQMGNAVTVNVIQWIGARL